MMEYPLLLRGILERSRKLFPKKEIVSRDYTGIWRYNYGDFYKRVCRLANVLQEMGIHKGDRVATLAWNNHRHLELYFGVTCYGALLHTLNLRLFTEQLEYVINHAEDKVIFVDQDLLPLLEGIKDKLPTVQAYIVMTDSDELPATGLNPVYSYEKLLAAAPDAFDFPEDLDEYTPAAMCYTTATTGDPKGVIYTHRGLYLHSMCIGLADSLALSETDSLLPIVPMFHVNAWGLPYACTWFGSKQVLPGARPDPATICKLIEEEKVTLAAGVPTIWMAVLAAYRQQKFDFSSVRGFVCGGSAAPKALIKAFDEEIGVPILHAYGMTETTPVVLVSKPKSYMLDWPADQLYDAKAKQGLLVPGLEMKVVDEEGREAAWDGKQIGELWLRGPWIAKEYYKDPERSKPAFAGGWLHTSDIVSVDKEGFVSIVDRAKDLIKSGGEWISSVDLENTIMAHPAVQEAAVVAMPHEKWVERPVACVVIREDWKGRLSEADIISFLEDKVAKWWLPDKVIFVDEIPKTSVGKFNKKALRQRLEQA
ncbi:long-chain fatty acid--CoA ligase [Desulfotruncus alcoholivorax]|uniref:long-chain fatty acid--CoA ligase n=1 Tax=Desulfotruncus alcoholivorax TaxID=265477 RepID=UPI00040F0129|nr:long-chain fatty acid--CoA ligase [Desulfotruncus alcoholivorax]